MTRLDKLLGTFLLFLAFVLLLTAVVFIGVGPSAALRRRGSVDPAEPTPASIAEAAAKAVQADRPAQVGNAEAEAFLRKVERKEIVPASGPIRVVDEIFSAAYDELYDNRDKYYGREIELAGYVQRQDGLEEGAFLVGRKLLWCCELDAYFIGFLVLGSGPVPAEGSAVRVRGRLEAAPYANPDNGKTFTVPAIRVESIERAEGVPLNVFPGAN
jgi:uncharacterized membrane protein YcgQ (UPF0703/DUF1980 family)